MIQDALVVQLIFIQISKGDKMTKPKGMTINYSMVTNENGEQEVGFRYNDTDGVNVDRHFNGGKDENVIGKLYTEVLKEINAQSQAIKQQKLLKEKKAQEKKQKPVKNYDEIILDLQKKLKAAEEEAQSLRIDNEILNRRVEETLAKKEPQQDNLDFYKAINNFLDELGL